MSNGYYDGPAGLIAPFTLGRAEAVSAQMQGIAAGFDKLPDPRRINENRISYTIAGGTANALAVALPVAPVDYQPGLTVKVKVAATNTDAVTLNVNGLGPQAVQTYTGAALPAGALIIGAVVEMVYDGAAFRITGAPAILSPADVAAIGAGLAASYMPIAGGVFTGPIAASTPNVSTSGGIKLRGNPVSGFAYLQVLNSDGTAEWGNWKYDASGNVTWISSVGGAGGGGGTMTVNGSFTCNRNGDFTTPGNLTVGGVRIRAAAGGACYLQVTNNGATSEWGYFSFNSAGLANWSGTLTSSSDARLKDDVRTVEGAGGIVTLLRGVRFSWKRDGRESIGVIAQELQEVLPELVHENPDGMLSVDYMGLSGVLIEALKALHERITRLEARE